MHREERNNCNILIWCIKLHKKTQCYIISEYYSGNQVQGVGPYVRALRVR